MPSYLSPGVYVEEIPSSVQTIAGVGTSTAGFIGIVGSTASYVIPQSNPFRNAAVGSDPTLVMKLPSSANQANDDAFAATLVGATLKGGTEPLDLAAAKAAIAAARAATPPATTVEIMNTVMVKLPPSPATQASDDAVANALAGATLKGGTAPLTLADAQKAVADARAASAPSIQIMNTAFLSPTFTIDSAYVINSTNALSGPKLCTNFSEFRKAFGDFSVDKGQNTLAHAVHGFFSNGGTRCYVAVVTQDTDIAAALDKFGAIDEIALVAAPGLNSANVRDEVVTHCKVMTQDRFAILDSDETLAGADLTEANIKPPPRSDYAAFYFPWIQVFDPAKKIQNPVPDEDGLIYVPPSGHMAGVYARVDTNRGVFKAPANEPVMGALGLKYQISKAQQDGLNPQGINCIREFNGSRRVWGARTIGGDANGEWRYINVRRTFLYLRESIQEGTQWAVFEPNDQRLWEKIKLNVSAFLTTAWRSGALFGSTAAEAFYVKCDAETNPPELREIGQVVTEIGVAVVRPAEFVIFRISQWQPQPGS